MSKAEATARYLIHLANQEPEAELVTHLRLQKLLYYVQGYSLAVWDRPFFSERIEAWRNGPVVRAVYRLFAEYEDAPLPAREGRDLVPLSDQEKAFVRSLWEHHKQYSASALWQMTHREAPWRNVWANRPDDASGSDEIPPDAMRVFFKRQLEQQRIPGLEPEKVQQAEREAAEGQTVGLEQLARRLACGGSPACGAGRAGADDGDPLARRQT